MSMLYGAPGSLSYSPTTTYPHTYTTYSTSLPKTSFSKPTSVPSIFPFSGAPSCTKNSVATPLPSNFPQEKPSGDEASCVISNAVEINDHAFWDMYECCSDMKNVVTLGKPFPCTAQCIARGGQTFEQLADCLRKKVDVVVCKPYFKGNGTDTAPNTASASASASSSLASGSAGASASGSASRSGSQTSQSQGVAGAVGVGGAAGSKAVALVFGVLVVSSVFGMML